MLGALRCVQLVNIWGGLSFFFSIKKMEKKCCFSSHWGEILQSEAMPAVSRHSFSKQERGLNH